MNGRGEGTELKTGVRFSATVTTQFHGQAFIERVDFVYLTRR